MFPSLLPSERIDVPSGYAYLILPGYHILVASLLAFRPTTSWKIISGAGLVALTSVLCTLNFNDPYPEVYGTLCSIGALYFHWFDRVVLENSDREKWHGVTASDEKDPQKSPPEPPQTFWPRLKWGWSNGIATRGIAKSWQVKKVPAAPAPGTGRWTFVASQLLQVAWFMTLADMGKIYGANTALTGYRYWDDPIPKGGIIEPKFFSLSIWERTVCTWIYVCESYWTMGFVLRLSYAVGVGAGIWKPEECPSGFGDLRYFYTVRNAWGTVWHQFLRRVATVNGQLVAKTWLKLTPGTFFSKYIQLFVGFATTGLIHSTGSFIVCGEEGGEFGFWMMMATAIFIEDHLILLGKQLGFKDNRFWRSVGVVWTFAAFTFCGQEWLGISTERGGFVSRRPPDLLGFDTWLKSRRGAL